jgi:hypothetical protein
MYKKIVQEAFKKAQREIPGKTTKTSISEHISEVLLNGFKTQISGRTLRNLIDESNKIDAGEDISISTDYILYLCKYLGYEDYNAFLKSHPNEVKNKNKVVGYLKSNWIILLICFITIIGAITVSAFNKQRWMVWDDTKYVETDFDAEKYNLNQLKLYKEEHIENFKKLVPNCETKYFNEDGSEMVWYGKNKNGDLEYFSFFGKHPDSGKTLKPITEYMIRKYICDSYN